MADSRVSTTFLLDACGIMHAGQLSTEDKMLTAVVHNMGDFMDGNATTSLEFISSLMARLGALRTAVASSSHNPMCNAPSSSGASVIAIDNDDVGYKCAAIGVRALPTPTLAAPSAPSAMPPPPRPERTKRAQGDTCPREACWFGGHWHRRTRLRLAHNVRETALIDMDSLDSASAWDRVQDCRALSARLSLCLIGDPSEWAGAPSFEEPDEEAGEPRCACPWR